MGLLQARLRSRLQVKGISSFTQFHEQVLKADPSGWGAQLLIDLSTVNHTSFFREPAHFTFMAERIMAWLKESPGMPVRIWSAGCSSGQEPYSMAMVLAETISGLLVAEGGDLGERPFARDAQACGRRNLHDPRCAGSLAGAAQAVLLAGTRPACGLVSRRARDPRPGEVPPPGPAEPRVVRAQRFSDHFLPQRVDLFRRRRAIDPAQPAGAAPAAREAGWPWATARSCRKCRRRLRKHSPSLFQKEG